MSFFEKTVFLVCSALILFNIWRGSFVNSDDIIYVEMARQMSASGNFLDLQYQGAVEHLRPPLAIWLLALSGSMFGFEEFGMRLPVALSAIFSLLFQLMISRQLFDNRETAAYSVMLLVASAIFYFNSRRVMTDTVFLLGMLAFFWSYLKALKNPSYLIVSGVSAGWMVMTKGVVSAIAFVPVFMDILLRKRKDILTDRNFILGVLIALLLILPWHAIQSARFGLSFWKEYIGFNVMERAAATLFLQPGHLFYIERFIEDEGLLTLLYMGGIIFSLLRLLKVKGVAERFLLLWALSAFLPFQIAQTKLPHYMIPLYPALALMTASFLTAVTIKRLLSVAISVLIAALFVSNNLGDMLSPNYSPDQKEFARFVKENSSPNDTVTAFNYYDLALAHYSERRLSLGTDDKNMYSILAGVPLLERAGCVRLASIEEIISSAPKGRKLFIIVKKNLTPAIRAAFEKSNSFSQIKIVKGRRLVLFAGL